MCGRHTLALALLAFDRDNAQECATIRTMFPEIVTAAAALGYAPYRAHTAFMDFIASQYNADDSALRHTVEKIKDALDPYGILSPGKQGIWPGTTRQTARA